MKVIPSESISRIEKASESEQEFVSVKTSDLQKYLTRYRELDGRNFVLELWHSKIIEMAKDIIQ